MGQPQQAAPTDLAQTAADLVHNDTSLPESAPAARLVELFEANPLLDGVAVETAFIQIKKPLFRILRSRGFGFDCLRC